MDKHQCLDILGLNETATEADIKKAYKSIALKTHPDKLVDLDENERNEKELQFKDASEAYKRLIDNNFSDIFDDIFGGSESMASMFGGSESMASMFGGSEGMANMFGGSEGIKMFSGMANKLFQSQSFQSIFKTSVKITYYDLIYKRKLEKQFNLCGMPTKAIIDCSKFPKQFITRSFNGLSSTAEIDFKLEDDDVYESIIHQNGKVDLIYQMKISHYDYYKGFNHSFVHIDGNNVSFKAKKMSKKTLKIKSRGLNGGDLLIKMVLYNPSNNKLKNISNEEYETFLNTLNALCNDK
jgi:curved DNA-binding protein CbpA